MALISFEGFLLRLLLHKLILKLQEFLADGWRHFSPEWSSKVFLSLAELLVDFCDGGTTHQIMMHSHPAAECLLGPFLVYGSKDINENTKESTGIENQPRWLLNPLNVIHCRYVYTSKHFVKYMCIAGHFNDLGITSNEINLPAELYRCTIR